jgi:hypothetical protein
VCKLCSSNGPNSALPSESIFSTLVRIVLKDVLNKVIILDRSIRVRVAVPKLGVTLFNTSIVVPDTIDNDDNYLELCCLTHIRSIILLRRYLNQSMWQMI